MAPRRHPPQRPAPRLYLITPRIEHPAAFAEELAAALGAADFAAVLLPLVEAGEQTQADRVKALAPTIQDRGVALLLEGEASLVELAGADGAHISRANALGAALDRLKPDRIVGAGRLDTRHDAMIAAEAGADYVMF